MTKRISNKVLLLFGVGILSLCIGIVLMTISSPNKENEKEETGTPIGLDSYEVYDSYTNYQKLRIFESELFNEKGFDINQISDDSLLSTLLYQVPFEKIGFCGSFMGESQESIELDTLNRWLRDVVAEKEVTLDFLKEKATFYDSNFNVNTTSIASRSNEFDVDEFFGIRDAQIYVGSNMCEGNGTVKILKEKINKATMDDNYVYLYITRAFYIIMNDKVSYYKDPTLTTNVETLDAEITNTPTGTVGIYEQANDLSWDKYNEYKLTFKMIEGKYHLLKVELYNKNSTFKCYFFDSIIFPKILSPIFSVLSSIS